MDSVRSFLAVWILLTAGILGYAIIDLRTHPELNEETTFSMQPDVTKIHTLPHWGGRLLKERAHGLLIMNAVVLAGLVSLSGGVVVARIKKRRAAPPVEPRVSAPPRLSVPPPLG